MKKLAQTSDPDRPTAYGRRRARAEQCLTVMVSLAPDAAAAVRQLIATHGISRSGAVHHLVRLGAGLPPLPPLD